MINGGLISKFKIPPFIATLGMMTVARGFALIYSNKPLSQ
jgi:ribose/xylose/arabinose/galactoside ABC-type transport system permease subunit